MALDTATRNSLMEVRALLETTGLTAGLINQQDGMQLADTGQLGQNITSFPNQHPFGPAIKNSQPMFDKQRSAGQRILKAMTMLDNLLA
jgi:hypothetical protein